MLPALGQSPASASNYFMGHEEQEDQVAEIPHTVTCEEPKVHEDEKDPILDLEILKWEPFFNVFEITTAAVFHLISLYDALDKAQMHENFPLPAEAHYLFLNFITLFSCGRPDLKSIKTFSKRLEELLIENNRSSFFNAFKEHCNNICLVLTKRLPCHVMKTVGELKGISVVEEDFSKSVLFTIKQLFVIKKILIQLLDKSLKNDLVQENHSKYKEFRKNFLNKVVNGFDWERSIHIINRDIRIYIKNTFSNLKKIHLHLEQKKMDFFHFHYQQMALDLGPFILKRIEGHIEEVKALLDIELVCTSSEELAKQREAFRQGALVLDDQDVKRLRERISGDGSTFTHNELQKALYEYKKIQKENVGQAEESNAQEIKHQKFLSIFINNYIKKMRLNKNDIVKLKEEIKLMYDNACQLCDELNVLKAVMPFLGISLQITHTLAKSVYSEKEDAAGELWLSNDRAFSSSKISVVVKKEESKKSKKKKTNTSRFSSQLNTLMQSNLHGLKDAAYHLQVFAFSVDLFIAMQRKAIVPVYFHALLFRFIRNVSISADEMRASYSLETLSEKDQQFLQTIDLGWVFHRYPLKTAHQVFIKKELPLPLTLELLLMPEKISEEGLRAFVHSTVTFFGSITQCSYSELDKKIDQKKGSEKDKQDPFLKKALGSSLRTITYLRIQINENMKEEVDLRKLENWKEVELTLSLLHANLNCWVAYPEPSYLASHVDAILTLLQCLDEQIGIAHYDDMFNYRLYTHDLEFYRLPVEPTKEYEKVISYLNVGMGGQYPHRSKRQSDSAAHLRLEALNPSFQAKEKTTRTLVELVIKSVKMTKMRIMEDAETDLVS